MGYVQLKSESTDETLCFEVRSSTRNITHDVSFDIDNGWACTCEQYYYRKKPCKHMREAQKYYKKFYELMDINFIFKGK